MEKYLSQVRSELRLRNYSPKTVQIYLSCLKDYFGNLQADFPPSGLERVDEARIKHFLLGKVEKGYSPQTVNLYLNSIKFFYYQVLKSQVSTTSLSKIKSQL